MKNFPPPTNFAAFSLVELLVVIAITGFLSVTLLQFMVNFMNLKFSTEMTQRINQEGNYALDRIESLIRNSLTVPDICVNSESEVFSQVSSDTLSFTNGYVGCPQTVLRTNTQAQDSGHFQRSMVFLPAEVDYNYNSPNCDDKNNQGNANGSSATENEKNQITLSQPLEQSGETNILRHNNPQFNEPQHWIALTSALAGSSGSVPFKVTNLKFTCAHDNFTNGRVVNVEFYISYDRNTLTSWAKTDDCYDDYGRLNPILIDADPDNNPDDCSLTLAKFSRSIPIRNDYPFEY